MDFAEFVDKMQKVIQEAQSVASQAAHLCNILRVHLKKLDKLKSKNAEMVKTAQDDMKATRKQLKELEKVTINRIKLE